MIEPKVRVYLDGNRRVYQPADFIRGEYIVDYLSTVHPSAVELAVLWYTEGKGDEDMAVHFFERRSHDQGVVLDLRKPSRISVELPGSPLSYDGAIVRIRWCIRVRVFFEGGKEIVAEESFRLGRVQPGVAVGHETPEHAG